MHDNQLPATTADDNHALIERMLTVGDLAGLTPEERNDYYFKTCKSLGLNPLTKPFEYLKLNGKLVMYARKDCTDQLRKLHGVSLEILEQKTQGVLLLVKVRATDKTGRVDEEMGVVSMPAQATPEVMANTIMKGVTKAKRRATLSICGLGFLDETEVQDIPAEAKGPALPGAKFLPPIDNDGVVVGAPHTVEAPDGTPLTAPYAMPKPRNVGECKDWTAEFITHLSYPPVSKANIMAWVNLNQETLSKMRGQVPSLAKKIDEACAKLEKEAQ